MTEAETRICKDTYDDGTVRYSVETRLQGEFNTPWAKVTLLEFTSLADAQRYIERTRPKKKIRTEIITYP